jgi:hypothetical protein
MQNPVVVVLLVQCSDAVQAVEAFVELQRVTQMPRPVWHCRPVPQLVLEVQVVSQVPAMLQDWLLVQVVPHLESQRPEVPLQVSVGEQPVTLQLGVQYP